jgi:hypothetical protein
MSKGRIGRLRVSRETVRDLTADELTRVGGNQETLSTIYPGYSCDAWCTRACPVSYTCIYTCLVKDTDVCN